MKDSFIKFYAFANKRETNSSFEILLVPVLTLFFYGFLRVLLLDEILKDINISKYINIFLLVVIFVVLLCIYNAYHKTLKGVFLYSNHIQIIYAITKRNLLNIKPKIEYSKITKCEKISNSFENKVKYNIALNYIAGAGSDYVMIETIDNKTFFFCVKDQEEFLQEVISRINSIDNN